ncbi:MAG: OFA family MFS transporter [Eubacterium sp.]|jgi:Sugar phosphate permease|nr:OFA family MFS transporter [Eubacterium sp.]
MKKLNRWVYAIVGVIVLLLAGLVYAWSVMSKSIGASRPDWTATQLSMTFTLVMAFFCIGCLIAGILAKKVSPKIYVLLSGVLFLAGFLLAGTTGASPAMLYVGFGVLCGLGAGFAYNAVMSTMSMWFPDKQGLISGILLMGFGLSAFIIGKVFAAVTPSDGSDTWHTTFRVLGIIIVVVMAVCSFFFVKPGADFTPPVTAKRKEVREPASDINSGAMVKKASFWLYYIWAILISAAGLVLVSQASGIATQVGTQVSDGNIATVVGLISICNGIGRVIFGGLFDKKGYKMTMIVDMVVFIIASLVLILALTTGNFALIVIGFIVGGFAYGGVTPTNSAIISDFFGRTNYSMNFSLVNTNLLIASFASTIAGRLYDASGSYLSTIFMMIGVTVVGFVVFLGIRRPKPE